jgi:hypothetical protein
MFFLLKNHPFAVEAYFESSYVLTFAVPKEQLETRIPECLALDTHNDKWAFVAVAMVQTQGLRPKGFPHILGRDFFLVGYRIFVRYVNNKGKRLRGLYILKSETDKKAMEFLGNLFTHYNYATINVEQTIRKNSVTIKSQSSRLEVEIETDSDDEVMLPMSSPFADWKEARRFAGPLPFTFTYYPKSQKVLIIEGVRQNWIPRPVNIQTFNIPFLETLGLSEYRLANAFVIKDIPYHWKKGVLEKWMG